MILPANLKEAMLKAISSLAPDISHVPVGALKLSVGPYSGLRFDDLYGMRVGEFLNFMAAQDDISRKEEKLIKAVLEAIEKAHTDLDAGRILGGWHYFRAIAKKKRVKLPQKMSEPFFLTSKRLINDILSALDKCPDDGIASVKLIYKQLLGNLSDRECSELFGLSSERFRQLKKELAKKIATGRLWNTLNKNYEVRASYRERLEEIKEEIQNGRVSTAMKIHGRVPKSYLRIILDMMGLMIVEIEGEEYIVPSYSIVKLKRAVAEVAMRMRREFKWVAVEDVVSSFPEELREFLIFYMEDHPETYEFKREDGTVRMIGRRLEKCMRIARVIYEAGDWIDKHTVLERCREIYGETSSDIMPAIIAELGFVCQGKTSYWRYGDKTITISEFISSRFTDESPLDTYDELRTEAEKLGMFYSNSSLRNYVNEIATSSVLEPNLLCKRGHEHEFPAILWHSTAKEVKKNRKSATPKQRGRKRRKA